LSSIDLIDTDAALEALRPEWDALWTRTPGATPFQSPRWLLPWWHQFGTGMPRVAIAREQGLLVGVLPLYVLPQERKALPIGAGTTDYLDGLGALDGLLARALDRLRGEVDCCDLIEVPPGSALLGAAPAGWCAEWRQDSPCPVLTLPDIPSGIRRKLRMNRHRAERDGGWSVADAELDMLVELHQRRWTGQGEPGVLASPAVLAFWREALPGLQAGGLVRLLRLEVGAAVAACIMALLAPGRIYFYLSGFDDAHTFVSPGTLLLGAMLEQAIAEGRCEAHFLRGQERYKYAWGAVDRCNAALRLAPSSRADVAPRQQLG